MIQLTTHQQARVVLEGRVYGLAASPDFGRDGICFAALESGLYRSDDGGMMWRGCYDVQTAADSPTTTAVALTATFAADRTVFAAVQGGILRSNDGGSTWHGVILPAPAPLISTLGISPCYTDDGTLLAGTVDDGVFRSVDRGQHWLPANFGLLDLQILALAISPGFAQDETVFLGTETSLYRSTNGGRAWRDLEPPEAMAPILSLALSPAYAEDRTVFAGTEASGLWVSHDRGDSWSPLIEASISPVNGLVFTPMTPTVPGALVVLGESLIVSFDYGQIWFPAHLDLPVQHNVAAIVAPSGLAAGAPVLVGLAEGGVAYAQWKAQTA